jgi:hypothetical protein
VFKRKIFLLFIGLSLACPALRFWAQTGPTPTFTENPFAQPTGTPTPTATDNPFATPTFTPTWNPFATDTPTPGSPTDTFTPTYTFTNTPTGTLTPTATFTFTWTNTPSISRAKLALLPTAYTNAWDRWDGFNWDIDFTYYIGSIVSRDETGSHGLEQTNLVLLTSDVKYAWLNDNGEMPGIASGFLLSFLAQIGTTSSGSGGGNSSTGGSGTVQAFNPGSSMGGLYTVMSKTIGPRTAVHFGYIYGLDQVANGFISNNYAQLLPSLNNGLYNTTNPSGNGGSPPDTTSLFYVGFNTRFLERNWKFEIWKPIHYAEEPILFNSQIDGLPLAFNLAYERWQSGFALLGYVNIPITLVPQTPAY